jgi:hypothetical protein
MGTGSLTPEDIAALVSQYQSSQSSDSDASRDLLRRLNEELGLGLEIPITFVELEDAA